MHKLGSELLAGRNTVPETHLPATSGDGLAVPPSEVQLPGEAERCSGPGRDGGGQCENWIIHKAARLCRGHYSQQRRHGELEPLANMRNKGLPCPGPGFDGKPCGLRIHSRRSGLCKSHNNQSLQGRELRSLQRRQVPAIADICSGPGTNGGRCDRVVAYKKSGLCTRHHIQQKAGEDLRALNSYRHANDARGECTYESCSRPLYCRGLCAAHYSQRMVGQELGPLVSESRSSIPCTARNELGEKHCPGCSQWHDRTAFSVHNNRDDNLSEFCRTCRTANRARTTYGLTRDAYAAMLIGQGGGCAICGPKNRRSNKSLNIDHDHDCCPGPRSCGSCVRGILCDDCNLAIGHLRDDVELAKRAALYLLLGGTIPPLQTGNRL